MPSVELVPPLEEDEEAVLTGLPVDAVRACAAAFRVPIELLEEASRKDCRVAWEVHWESKM